MRLRKKKTLMDQATDFVDSLKPALESAVDTAKEAVETAIDRAGPVLTDAKDTVVERTGPVLADVRERGSAAWSDARESAAPVLAHSRAVAAEKASVGASLLADKAAESREFAAAKVARLKGEPPPKKRSKLVPLLVVTGLAGLAAFIYKKMSAGNDSWQAAYSPTPPERSATGPGGTTGTAAAAAAAPATAAAGEGDDEGGASPDEALADATAQPHAVTTPEHPVETVQFTDEGAPYAPVEQPGDKA